MKKVLSLMVAMFMLAGTYAFASGCGSDCGDKKADDSTAAAAQTQDDATDTSQALD